MEIVMIITELLLLGFIVFINDLRIKLMIDAKENNRDNLKSSSYALAVFIGGLWFLFYEIYDVLKSYYFADKLLVFKILAIIIVWTLILSFKFLFKKKLLNASF